MSKNLIPGVRLSRHPRGIEILRVHYSADPSKDGKWAAELRGRMNPAAWDMEMEIDAYAKSGALLYPEFTPEFTTRPPFPIPIDWTRFMAIDPHPRVPHAMLWMAVSPFGDHVYYREYWPSTIYARRGNIPDDDEVRHIDEYVSAINLLESSKVDVFSPNGFADNGGHDEFIQRRIMDTAGKAWETQRNMGVPGEESFWDRYSQLGIHCEIPKKDFQVGRDIVGTRLRGRRVSDGETESMQSQIVIFDTLPELILELQTVRYPTMTPMQLEKADPGSSPLKKRCHMTDLLRYIEMSDVQFMDRTRKPRPVSYQYKGIPY